MSRMSLLSSPLLLGFEEMERLIDRVGKGGDGYPPYNIERIAAATRRQRRAREPVERLRITLAVAGFKRDQLEITLEDNQLTIRGRQEDDKSRAVHPSRHCRAPVQPHVRAGRRHRGEVGRSQRWVAVHRPGAARAGSSRAQDRDRQTRSESFGPQLLGTEFAGRWEPSAMGQRAASAGPLPQA